MSDQTPAVELRIAHVFFKNRRVLEDLNRRFPSRSATAIYGPSGSGKTTLLRTLSRMNDDVEGFRVEGRVLIDGENIYSKEVDASRLRRKVGMLFQKPCVFPKSIYQNVVFGLRHRDGIDRKALPEMAESVLREVRLWDEVKDRLNEWAPTLSQGQQQRLALARLLILEPKILLMDEPTSSLDPRSVEAIEALIERHSKLRAILLVTHNLEQARRVCDEIVFMDCGRFLESPPLPHSSPAGEELLNY